MSPAPRTPAIRSLTQLAQQIGVSTVTAANGSQFIYTGSGVTLFQDTPRAVSFTATPTLVDGANGASVTVDGVPITGPVRRCRSNRARLPAMQRCVFGRARISGPARPDRGRPDQRLRRERSIGHPTLPSLLVLATTPGATGPALDHDRSRGGDRGQSERRPVAGRRSHAPARRRNFRPSKSAYT